MWGTPNHLFGRYRRYFVGEQRQEQEVYHLPPSSAEVNNACMPAWHGQVNLYLCCTDFFGTFAAKSCRNLLLPSPCLYTPVRRNNWKTAWLILMKFDIVDFSCSLSTYSNFDYSRTRHINICMRLWANVEGKEDVCVMSVQVRSGWVLPPFALCCIVIQFGLCPCAIISSKQPKKALTVYWSLNRVRSRRCGTTP